MQVRTTRLKILVAVAAVVLAAVFAYPHVVPVEKQQEISHVVHREILHLFSGASVFLIMLWLFRILRSRGIMHCYGYAGYIAPCILAGLVIFLREPIDASNVPHMAYKSYLDLVFWWLGNGWGAYATYRLEPHATELNLEIERSRRE